MVDTVPYTEKLTSQRLERILLGGLHPNIRKSLRQPRTRLSKDTLASISVKVNDDSDGDSDGD
jgi:hypothetical protein